MKSKKRKSETEIARREYHGLLKAGKYGQAARLAHRLGGRVCSVLFACLCSCHTPARSTICDACSAAQAEPKRPEVPAHVQRMIQLAS